MKSLYISVILALAIGYCAPRIVTAENQGVNSTDLLYSLAIYSMLVFLLISVCIIEISQSYINESRLKIYTILCLSLYFSFCQNIYGILLATKSYLDSTIYLSIVVIIYIALVLKSSVSGTINLDLWLNGAFVCLLVAVTSAIAITGLHLVSYKKMVMFATSREVVKILLPSVIAGLVNGVALLVLYLAYVENSESVHVAFLGYILVLKSASQFFSQVANKIIFINLSHIYAIGDFRLTKDYFGKILGRNLISMVLAMALILISYFVFYDIYFVKYVGVPAISYVLLFGWLLLEILYFVLYQVVQINGLMWKSLFFISIPSLIYSGIINVFTNPTDIAEMLIIYCGLTCLSITGITYIAMNIKAVKERNYYV